MVIQSSEGGRGSLVCCGWLLARRTLRCPEEGLTSTCPQLLSLSHQKKQLLPCSAPALLTACAQLQQLGQDPVDVCTPAQVPSSCQVESAHTNHLKPCKKRKPAYACSGNALRHGLGWPGCPYPGCWGQGRDTGVVSCFLGPMC